MRLVSMAVSNTLKVRHISFNMYLSCYLTVPFVTHCTVDVYGVPKRRIFGICIISLAQSAFRGVPVTVKYFFNGAEVVSVALNTSATDRVEWGGSVGKAHIDILDLRRQIQMRSYSYWMLTPRSLDYSRVAGKRLLITQYEILFACRASGRIVFTFVE